MYRIILPLVCWSFWVVPLTAEIRLPRLIGDHMVLQRNVPVAVWGNADPGETVVVSFQGKERRTAADSEGRWKVFLPPMPVGGPYEMQIKGANTITLRDILVGEVWVASGQSNMQWVVKQSANADEEIARAEFPQIRLFSVKRMVSDQPKDKRRLAGGTRAKKR